MTRTERWFDHEPTAQDKEPHLTALKEEGREIQRVWVEPDNHEAFLSDHTFKLCISHRAGRKP